MTNTTLILLILGTLAFLAVFMFFIIKNYMESKHQERSHYINKELDDIIGNDY